MSQHWTLLVVAVAFSASALVEGHDDPELNRPRLLERLANTPLHFEPYGEEADPHRRFVAHGRGHSVILAPNQAVLALHGAHGAGDVITMRLVGSTASTLEGRDPVPSRSNYLIGDDPSKWRLGVPHYGRVASTGVYPGIDLIYHGHERQLEYDFVVAPGADPRLIRMKFSGGVEKLRLDPSGNLVVATSGGPLVQKPPLAWQEIVGQRQPVESRYVLKGRNEVALAIGTYDPRRPLVIDPLLVYSTYLGGSALDEPRSVAVDGQGAVYLTGYTATPVTTPFPTTPGAYQPTYGGGNNDVFIAKLNPAGGGSSDLVYSTYLGGMNDDIGWGIAVDGLGAAYIVGETSSAGSGFPTTQGAFQRTSLDGRDAFFVKLDPSGGLAYATYLGGGGIDMAKSVAVDASGIAYITGSTQSTLGTGPFPTTAGAYQTTNAGMYDIFLAKLKPQGSGASDLLYSTLYGGNTMDLAQRVRVNGQKAYVAGYSSGLGALPTTPGAFQPSNAGAEDAFLAVFSPAGLGAADLTYATYLGGSGLDLCFGLAVDASGVAYLGGYTASGGTGPFPTTVGAYQTTRAGTLEDGFIAKINPAGAGHADLLYSTYVGGSSNDYGLDLAIDNVGAVYLTGNAGAGYPTTPNAYQGMNAGLFDAFLTRLLPAGRGPADLLYSTFFGGVGNDSAYSLALDGGGVAHLAGSTADAIPTTAGAFQANNAGSYDAFLAKLAPPALRFYTVAPCRLVDTRGNPGPLGGPALSAGGIRTFTIAGGCNVPVTARAVSVNITATGASALGDLRLYPAAVALPLASALNYSTGQTRANNAVLSLNSAGALAVLCEQLSGTVDFILDVNGYME